MMMAYPEQIVSLLTVSEHLVLLGVVPLFAMIVCTQFKEKTNKIVYNILYIDIWQYYSRNLR